MRVLLCIVAVLVAASPVAAQTYVTGDIFGTDEDWTPAGSPYIIQSDVTVIAATLTIQSTPTAGVRVEFDGDYLLATEASGSIEVTGNADHPVVFTSHASSPAPADWRWVQTGGYGTASFSHCIFEYASAGIRANRHDSAISHCEFRHCWSAGVNCLDASPTIQHCDFHDNGNGILVEDFLDQSHPSINNNNFYNNSSRNLKLFPYPEPAATIDAQNNWWGTDIEVEIQAGIYDRADNPAVYATVDYDPWLHEVPVEPVTWGRLKALFAD